VSVRRGAAAAALLATSIAVPAQRPGPTRTELAPGIFLYQTAAYGDVGLDGNSIAITSSDGVLVFDSNGTPAAAAAVLADIRTLTSQPVRYVVNSHWHWDHWYGTEVYRAAFPAVQVVAHEATRRMMMGPALEFNRPGIEKQLPDYVAFREQKAAAARTASPPAPDADRLEQLASDDRFFLEQKRGVRHTFPNVTFESALHFYFGGRHVEVLHYDRAVTPGDTFLYLPDEKVLITGDLLVNPVSFALSCYPTGWLHTLERIDSLDFATIVPGHGPVLHDRELLHATMEVFRTLLREGKAARTKGLDPDRAREAIMPALHDLMVKITGDVPAVNDAFRVQLVDWYLHRVYDELSGPLTDAIAPIPES
jgi:cyclase